MTNYDDYIDAALEGAEDIGVDLFFIPNWFFLLLNGLLGVLVAVVLFPFWCLRAFTRLL